MSGSIGAHTFLQLNGNVGRFTQEIEVIEKPGEDGCVLRDRGARCPVFQLVSLGQYATKAEVETALFAFEDEKTAANAVVLVKDGYDYATDPANPDKMKVRVLQIEVLEKERKACISGDPAKPWLLTTRWTLIGVPA